jgi:hypothetical protein
VKDRNAPDGAREMPESMEETAGYFKEILETLGMNVVQCRICEQFPDAERGT